MPHTPPRNETIEDFGLQHWIDTGRAKQNGYGWTDFDKMCRMRDGKGLPDAVLATIFNKSNKTIKDWKRRRVAALKGEG